MGLSNLIFAQNCSCEDPLITERYYCQNLEDLATGSFANQTSPTWTTFYSNSDPGTVTRDRSFDGSKSLRFNDETDLLHHINANDGFGIHRVEWRNYFRSGSAMGYGLVYDLSLNEWSFYAEFDNGTASFYSGTSQNLIYQQEYQENKWIQIVNLVNINSGDIEIWIDGEFVTAFDYRDGSSNGNINKRIDALNIWDLDGAATFYLDKYCYRELLRNPPFCTNVYDPVCVVDQEFSNDCYAQNAGYTDNEWTYGPCGSYDPCSDCGKCFDYYFDHHDPTVIHCYSNYCEDDDPLHDTYPYYWEVKDANGQLVNPLYVDGDENSAAPSMQLAPGSYTICFYIDDVDLRRELCCLTIVIPSEPCYLPPTCGIEVQDFGNGDYDLLAFGEDVDSYQWVFPEELLQGQDTEGEFSTCRIPWGKCYTVCLYAFNECGMTYNCITLCNTSDCSYPEIIPVPEIDIDSEDNTCEMIGLGALVDLDESYTYEWIVPAGVEVGVNGNDNPEDIPTIFCPGPGSYKICLIIKIGNCYTICYCWNVRFPGSGNCVAFDVGEADCEGPGSVVEIPIYTSDFDNITSFQFTLEIEDGSVAQFEGNSPVSSDILGGTLLSARISNNVATVTWNSPTGQPVSLRDGTKVLDVRIRLTGTDGDESLILITDSRTDIYVEDGDNRSLCVETSPGKCCVEGKYAIYGNVFTVEGRGIKDVNMYLETNGNPVKSTRTNNVGYYEFLDLSNQTYRVSGEKNLNVRNGLNVGDMLRTLDHILTVNPFTEPYQYLAADVDMDGSINTGDASEIQRVVGSVNSAFSEVESWLIMPEDEYFNLTIQNVLDHNYKKYADVLVDDEISLDFRGIKMGDVTNSADPQRANQETNKDRSQAKQLIVEDRVAMDGEEVWVSIRANEFEDMRGLQFSLNWDDRGLELLGIENHNPALAQLDLAIQQLSDNTLTCVWGGTSGVTLMDNEILFTLKFKVMGDLDDEFILSVQDNPTEILMVDSDFEEYVPEVINGSVTIQNTTSAIETERIQIEAYPNPFVSGVIILSDRPGELIMVEIINMEGKTCLTTRLNSGEKVNTLHLPNGTYLVNITGSDGAMVTKKMTKTN